MYNNLTKYSFLTLPTKSCLAIKDFAFEGVGVGLRACIRGMVRYHESIAGYSLLDLIDHLVMMR